VSPFELDDEILVHFFGAKDAGGDTGADDEAVLDGEGVVGGAGGDVDGDPAGEVLAVEEGDEAVGVGLGGEGG
jgi:hypothetical protein